MISLKASLRGEDELDELDGLLNATEITLLELKPIDFRPLFCLQNIQEAWGLSQDDKLIRECASKELEKVMPELSTGMMGLKRISNTSLPFGYVSHLRSFLVIWLCLLPFIYTYQVRSGRHSSAPCEMTYLLPFLDEILGDWHLYHHRLQLTGDGAVITGARVSLWKRLQPSSY